jgi:hypothetical protein
MRIRFKQLFGLSMSGSARAPFAQGRACRPQEATGCTSFAKPTSTTKNQRQAVDLWTMRLRRTGELTVDNAARCPPRSPSPTSSTAFYHVELKS